jgi:hypothetical protein
MTPSPQCMQRSSSGREKLWTGSSRCSITMSFGPKKGIMVVVFHSLVII